MSVNPSWHAGSLASPSTAQRSLSMQDLARGLDVVIAYGPFLVSHVQLQAYVALGKLAAGYDVAVVRSHADCSMPVQCVHLYSLHIQPFVQVEMEVDAGKIADSRFGKDYTHVDITMREAYVGERLSEWQPINRRSEPYKSCRHFQSRAGGTAAPQVLAPLLSPHTTQVELAPGHHTLSLRVPVGLLGGRKPAARGLQGKTREQRSQGCPASTKTQAQQKQQQQRDVMQLVDLVSSSNEEDLVTDDEGLGRGGGGEEQIEGPKAAGASSAAGGLGAPWEGRARQTQPLQPIKTREECAGMSGVPLRGPLVNKLPHEPGAGSLLSHRKRHWDAV